MKIVPLGIQCSVPEGIKRAGFREYSYPFDWLWCPSKTSYTILHILIHEGIESAIEYMTTGYSYYIDLGDSHFESSNSITDCKMNKVSGLGITHFTIDEEYKNRLRRRFSRLMGDLKSNDFIVFMYADTVNHSEFNYHLDNVEYGEDGTEYLSKLYDLLYPIHSNMKITYFCWSQRKMEGHNIEYIPYDFKLTWGDTISELIKEYILKLEPIHKKVSPKKIKRGLPRKMYITFR